MRAAIGRIALIALVLGATAGAGVAVAAAAPENLQAQTSGGNVFLTWRGGGTIIPDGYRIEAGSGPGLANLAIINLPWGPEQGANGVFAASAVAPGTYYVRVRALTNGVPGAASNEVIINVGASGCPMPGTPRNVVASVESPVVTLAWDGPAAAGAHATGYVIEAGTTPGAPNIAIIAISELTSLSVHAPPGRYFVRLRSMGQCGASEPSSEVEVIVPQAR